MILLSDANILIDFALVGGIQHLTRLGKVEVLDAVFEEARDPKITDPELLGLVIVSVQEEWIAAAQTQREGKLSLQDALCLYYAQAQNRVLLTTDAPLRKAALPLKVEVHGSLWVVQQLFERGLCDVSVLCHWLEVWPSLNARLPAKELSELKKRLGCTP